jgi:hypothetical protein
MPSKLKLCCSIYTHGGPKPRWLYAFHTKAESHVPSGEWKGKREILMLEAKDDVRLFEKLTEAEERLRVFPGDEITREFHDGFPSRLFNGVSAKAA